MVDIKSRWEGIADREKWAARGTSFMAKAKATKTVWFPPEPVETGRKAASTAKKQVKGAGKKTTGAARKGTGAASKSTKAATKKATKPARRTKKS